MYVYAHEDILIQKYFGREGVPRFLTKLPHRTLSNFKPGHSLLPPLNHNKLKIISLCVRHTKGYCVTIWSVYVYILGTAEGRETMQ